MDIKALANRVAAHYKTRNPFTIASELSFVIIRTPLLEMRGLRQYYKRRVILYINSDLDEQQQRLVCAHELGHHFLHRGLNRIFMDRHTFMKVGKFENEANQFAVELMFDDFDLQDYFEISTRTVARSLGISYNLAEYRMGTVNPRFF